MDTALGEGPTVGGQRPRNNSFNVDGVDNNRRDVTGSNVRYPERCGAGILGAAEPVLRGIWSRGRRRVQHDPQKRHKHDPRIAVRVLPEPQPRRRGSIYKRQQIDSIPRLDDNRLGASIGGPILKNKLFYYGLMEYHPIGQASSPSNALQSPTAQGYATLASIQGVSATNLGVLAKVLSARAGADRDHDGGWSADTRRRPADQLPIVPESLQRGGEQRL